MEVVDGDVVIDNQVPLASCKGEDVGEGEVGGGTGGPREKVKENLACH